MDVLYQYSFDNMTTIAQLVRQYEQVGAFFADQIIGRDVDVSFSIGYQCRGLNRLIYVNMDFYLYEVAEEVRNIMVVLFDRMAHRLSENIENIERIDFVRLEIFARLFVSILKSFF